MAQRATKLRKTEGAKTEQRLNNVFNALTEELLTTLEHNYDRKEG